MTAVIADAVFDAALTYISANATKAKVKSAANGVLVGPIALNASNFGANGDNGGAGGGRKKTCLVEDTGDMSGIAVASAGSATKVTLETAGDAVLISTDITGAPIVLGAADSVNLGTFDVILKDPT